MKKISKSTEKKRTYPNRQLANNHDKDMVYSFRSIPVSRAMIERMIDEIPKYIDSNPNVKTLTDYYISKGLSLSGFKGLLNKHEDLKEAYENGMRRLAERMWSRAVDKDANWAPIHFMLHAYAPEFKEATEFHANLSKKDTDSYTNFKIEMSPIPKSTLVPEKKEDDE